MAPAFAVMMAGEAAWALFEALELFFVEIRQRRSHSSSSGLPAAVTAILGLARGRAPLHRPHPVAESFARFTAICTPAVVLILFAWTNERHHFYWYDP